MPKTKVNISENVMSGIREGKVIMRPKIYFTLGSILTFIGVVASIVVSIFLVSLSRFMLRSHGPMGQFRLELIISSFPWWVPIVAVTGLLSGIILLKKYDFSYKKNFGLIILGIIAAVLISGYIIDSAGLADVWFRREPMRGVMRQYLQEKNIQPSPYGRGNFRNQAE